MKMNDLPPMTSVQGPAIELRGLHKHYGATHVVRHIDLTLPPQSFLVLLGPSGCGKSTLLRMLSGLEEPSEGSLHIHGKEVANGRQGILVPPGRRGLGLVFQSYALWPHMTVRGNIEWPLKVARLPAPQRRQRADEVMALMGISNLADRYPSEISGGQQQRVAIARMLSPAPGLLLFDEPLSNLDAKLRLEMRSELLRVHRQTGATSVYVTHDQVEAMTMATHVAVMNQGVIEQFGTPQMLLEQPASAFVATFVGTPAANVLPVQAEGGMYRIDGMALAPVHNGPAQAQLLYRATDLALATGVPAAEQPTLMATLIEVAPMAGSFVCTLMLGSQRISVVTANAPALQTGQTARVVFPPAPRACFDQHGKRLEVGA
ncbi:MAG: ABC transporter ATP-binding protein [Pseudomonadota bacterium]|nr:ABC transporter ATP-binding protein [Pseudomonadota bacterium]